ncbi:UMP kinase [Candidatus Nomurabacteria bacterium CG10_big_fil_rev_8_21_14_0_10_35_16]|uniref:UMP kinase n=1 Tax=Candidatus Nomurabacteria bacterium CG10_big_fil_rev_8_21_14_0_10_35_16 TaxID=1974731 RepID=A0A2H0TBB2_9BACT|nr:MAG: UMP kinase [Candidatus Nomurabacteria bacterium CG10_big_fil_rev_8_21_14_0_10_35_16]
MKEETIVISLGGSIIIPEELDTEFLANFRELILKYVAQGKKIIITTGGGKICRKYQDAAKKLSDPSSEDLDWIGIAALKLNAELVRVLFKDKAHPEVIADLSKPFIFEKPIVIGSAYRPNASSDVDAILAAITVGAKRVINLSNIDYAYDKDPNKYPDAKKIENISWAEYRDLIPKEWNPGLSTPFDPVASEMAEKEGIEVDILNGCDIANLDKCLNGEKFMGTVIR